MKLNKKWFIFLLLVLVIAVMSTAVFADITASYSISKSVVAGGGHQPLTGSGGYSLLGTVGQTAVDSVSVPSGYTVNSGFWNGGKTTYTVYLPTILK